MPPNLQACAYPEERLLVTAAHLRSNAALFLVQAHLHLPISLLDEQLTSLPLTILHPTA